MSTSQKKQTYNVKDIIEIAAVVILCVVMAILDLSIIKEKLTYSANGKNNELIADTVPLLLGGVAVIILMIRGKSRLFSRPQKLLYFLPALLIAVDNFPFHSYFAGTSDSVQAVWSNYICFALYCVAVGIFEECVFRGILFPLIAGSFSPDKKGLVKTFFLSSVVFGGMHIFNILAGAGVGATILQVGYSTLTGGLFAFVLIKNKNILMCALAHAVYDFCGLLLPKLGSGTVFDWQTSLTMAVVAVAVGAFVLYSLWKYPETEREELYKKLGFGVKIKAERDEN